MTPEQRSAHGREMSDARAGALLPPLIRRVKICNTPNPGLTEFCTIIGSDMVFPGS